MATETKGKTNKSMNTGNKDFVLQQLAILINRAGILRVNFYKVTDRCKTIMLIENSHPPRPPPSQEVSFPFAKLTKLSVVPIG